MVPVAFKTRTLINTSLFLTHIKFNEVFLIGERLVSKQEFRDQVLPSRCSACINRQFPWSPRRESMMMVQGQPQGPSLEVCSITSSQVPLARTQSLATLTCEDNWKTWSHCVLEEEEPAVSDKCVCWFSLILSGLISSQQGWLLSVPIISSSPSALSLFL